MTLLNLFFCQMFYYRKILYQEKKEDEEGNLRIDCDISTHSEGFFFQFKTETGICFLFFFIVSCLNIFCIVSLNFT